jgi:hypothetical protein
MVFDPALYERQRRGLQQNLAQKGSFNAYQRYLSNLQGERGLQDVQESAFGIRREVPRLTSAYGQRGLTGKGIKSGIYGRALNEYGQQQAKQTGRMQQDLQDSLRGYDLRQAGYQSEYDTGLADLESQKTAQIAQDAAALLNLR